MGTGDSKTAEEWLPVIYDELRRLAASKLAQERPGQTLQATALVHEAWLRLGADQQPRWESRAHFFGAAGEAMRRILIDRARKRQVRAASGLDAPEELHESRLELRVPETELLSVHEVLDGLAKVDVDAVTDLCAKPTPPCEHTRGLRDDYLCCQYFLVIECNLGLSSPPRSDHQQPAFAKAWLLDTANCLRKD